MTQEEKLAFMKAAGITVNGDLVLEKNVEYEIGNVEDGGIGIQVINGGKSAADAMNKTTSRNVTKTIESPKLVNSVFTYRWLDDYPVGIINLYQALLKGKFIAEDTKPDDFCKIFKGEDCGVKVKWIGKKAHLWYLFSLIFERQYVKWSSGVGQWIIVQSHFVDKNSKVFRDFNSQHKPKKFENAINVLAELLNPVSNMSNDDD